MRCLRTGLIAASVASATVGCGCQPPQVAKLLKSNDSATATTAAPQRITAQPTSEPRLPVVPVQQPGPPAGKVVEPSRKPEPNAPIAGPGAPAVGGEKKGRLEPTPPKLRATPPAESPQPAANVQAQDMKDIHLFVDTFSLAGGRMPATQAIYVALLQAKSPAAALVKSGDIVLTGTTTRESLWAMQKDAFAGGGWIVTHNGAEKVDAATAGRWLSGK